MAQYYTLSDIFKHEDTTRQYCISEDGANLSTPTVVYIWGFWLRHFTPFFPIFPNSDHFSKNLKNLKKTHIYNKIYHKTHHFMIYLTILDKSSH